MASRHKFHIPDSLRYESAPEIKIDESLSLEQQLRSLIGFHCPTNVAKYQLLKRRDELLCRLRVRNTDVNKANVLTGNCPDMCPEKERYMRDTQKNLNKYECDLNGVMIAERTVKDYSRSAADQEEPLPHELRPVNVLQNTMHYLIVKIANNIPSTAADMAKWYDFLWSRTRSIRKDITQQMLTDVDAADLVEKCARFHIFAAYRLSQLEEADFSQKMNTENLSKSFQTLRHMYDDMASVGRYCRNEAEFRSYDMILNLTDFNVHSQVLSYRSEIHASKPVQLALELASAYQSNNYVCFFRLLRERATFLQSCLCYRHFSAIRMAALKVMVQAYRMLPLLAVGRALGFDDEIAALDFLRAFGLDVDPSDGSVELINQRGRVLQGAPVDLPPAAGACRWIGEKMGDFTLPEILYNQPSVALDVRMPSPVNSFDELNRYNYDPVLKDANFGDNGGDVPSTSVGTTPRPGVGGVSAAVVPLTSVRTSVFPCLKTTFSPLISTSSTFPTTTNVAMSSSIFPTSAFASPQIPSILPARLSSVLAPSAPAPLIFPASDRDSFGPVRKRQLRTIPTFDGFKFTPPDTSAGSLNDASNSSSNCASNSSTTASESVAGSPAVQTPPVPIVVRFLFNYIELVSMMKVRMSRWRRSAQQQIARCRQLKRAVTAFTQTALDGLLATAIQTHVSAIGKMQYRLAGIRLNLERMWLKQFTGHWMKVVVQKRRLREIRLIAGSKSSLCPHTYFGSHRSAVRRPAARLSADRVQLTLYLAEFRRARREHIAQRYLRKWRDLIDYRRRKRFIDGFFTSTHFKEGFGGDLYSLAKKRKAMSLTSFPDGFATVGCNLSPTSGGGFVASSSAISRPSTAAGGSESDRENIVYSTPINDLNGNVGMSQNKRRRLFAYFKSHQFSPI